MLLEGSWQLETIRRLTEAERTELARHADAIRERCKTLTGFIREAWPVLEPASDYIHGWHIDAKADHLTAISNGQLTRLQINEPPGCMKSLVVGVFWPAWEWGPFGRPDLRYLTTSFAEANVIRDAIRMRRLVTSEWYQTLWPDVQLVRDQNAKSKFENTETGFREGRAFASLTGGRGDREIIDDPHSTETAESEAERANAARIFRESVPLRLNDAMKSAIVVIMQRLHEHDICGVIDELMLPYEKLILPMEFEPDRRCITSIGFADPRTEEGELLFPGRFPREAVDRDKVPLGSYGAAGQFQQRPAPREGGLFKKQWFEIVDAAPAGGRFVRAWDLAASKDGGDFTVGLLMKVVGGVYYILDVNRFRGSPHDVDRAIETCADQDAAAYGEANVRFRLPQDPGQAGKSQKNSHAKLLAGHTFRIMPVTGEKSVRAQPLASQAEAGNVKLLKRAWNAAFLDEIGAFPNAAHDDQVDAASDAFAELVATANMGGVVAMPMVITGSRPGPGG